MHVDNQRCKNREVDNEQASCSRKGGTEKAKMFFFMLSIHSFRLITLVVLECIKEYFYKLLSLKCDY